MTPIEAKDVIIEFDKGDGYVSYVCASDVSISRQMETKEVGTINDGNNAKIRGHLKRFSISISGMVIIDDSSDAAIFDLNDYFEQMTEIKFKMAFTDSNGNIKSMAGVALPTEVNIGGGSEGFADGSVVLTGSGALTTFDGTNPCNIVSTDLVFTQEAPGSPVQIFSTDTGGTAAQWKYSIDGGGDNYSSVNPFFVGVLSVGSHSFIVTPVCSNGYEGTSRTENYTVV